MLRRRDDLGKYARLVQELRLGSDSFHRYFLMSTEQFEHVLGLVEPHILRLPTVYVAICVQGRTTSYDVVRSVNAALLTRTGETLAMSAVCHDNILVRESFLIYVILCSRRCNDMLKSRGVEVRVI